MTSQPPKTALRMEQGLVHFTRCREELREMGTAEPHDLMRAAECEFILDCAEMAGRASLYRKESRWGFTITVWIIRNWTTATGSSMPT